MFAYVQRTGLLSQNGKRIGYGYSGHGNGLNNPAMQSSIGVGPLPCGGYSIGPAHKPIDHLGPLAFPLTPFKDNRMFGRSGFFIHGDNPELNHTASNGCIILPRGFRAIFQDTKDRVLTVVAEEADMAIAKVAA